MADTIFHGQGNKPVTYSLLSFTYINPRKGVLLLSIDYCTHEEGKGVLERVCHFTTSTE